MTVTPIHPTNHRAAVDPPPRVRWVTSAFALMLMAGGACGPGGGDRTASDGGRSTQDPRDGRAAPRQVITEDARTCELARRFRGFAGAFVEGDQLVLTFAAPPPADIKKVRDAVVDDGDATEKTVVRRVRYGFCRLEGWYDELTEVVFQFEGVVATDIDERTNAIWIAVTDLETWAPRIEAAADDLNIPRTAVQIEEMEPIELH